MRQAEAALAASELCQCRAAAAEADASESSKARREAEKCGLTASAACQLSIASASLPICWSVEPMLCRSSGDCGSIRMAVPKLFRASSYRPIRAWLSPLSTIDCKPPPLGILYRGFCRRPGGKRYFRREKKGNAKKPMLSFHASTPHLHSKKNHSAPHKKRM